MKLSVVRAAVVLVLPAAGFASSAAQNGQTPSEREISIRIHDYAKANHTVVKHAEQAAGRILKKAGIDARWIDCFDSLGKEACSRPFTTLDFVINLLPESMSDRMHLSQGVLGSAFEGSGAKNFGFSASVFYDIAKDRAKEHQVDFGELLGNAIAHELGHRLLGTNSHAGISLMSAFWSGTQYCLVAQSSLVFSDVEVKRIQTSVNARALAAMQSGRKDNPSSPISPQNENFKANWIVRAS